MPDPAYVFTVVIIVVVWILAVSALVWVIANLDRILDKFP